MSDTPAGWYPTGDGQQRYWDGAQWTDHIAPVSGEAPAAASEPTPAAETEPPAAGGEQRVFGSADDRSAETVAFGPQGGPPASDPTAAGGAPSAPTPPPGPGFGPPPTGTAPPPAAGFGAAPGEGPPPAAGFGAPPGATPPPAGFGAAPGAAPPGTAAAPPAGFGPPPAKKGGKAKILIPIVACVILALVAILIGALVTSGDDDDDADASPATTAEADEPDTTDEGDEPTTTADDGDDPAPTTEAPSGDADGTLENPFPAGTTQTVGDYEVTMTITLDATAQVQGANDFNDPPSNDAYALVSMDVTYIGSEEGDPGFDLSVVLQGGDGVQYDDTDCGATTPRPSFDVPTLTNGGSAQFDFCWDYPQAALDGGTAFVEPLFSFDDEERVYWELP